MINPKIAQHTPGPWTVRKYSTANVRDAEGVFAGESRFPLIESVWGESLEQSDANARLIAAAPELLEGLRAAVDALRHPENIGRMAFLIAGLDHTIRKARGEL